MDENGWRGTGFWAQPDVLGEKHVGIFSSLTRTERGCAKGTEFMSVPEAIQLEKGYIPLKTNRIKLDPILVVPKLREICTIGRPFNAATEVKCQPQARHYTPPASHEPTTKETARTFPSLIFGGHSVTWSDDVIDETVVKAELGLDCFAGDRQDAHLAVTNTGLTLAYDWKKLQTEDPFGFKKDAVQRFYFDHSYGIILPGETKHIAASFKSPGPGVYTETWAFETNPRLCGGRRVLLTLWGIARDRDVNRHGRDTIEKRLSHNQAISICQRILNEVFESMTPSPRLRAADDRSPTLGCLRTRQE
ncbi:MYCBP-associated protein-like [Haliotis rubra]|uniref:MYCBP-associated protein-like n=1 Tax=Haliotis rubra TaxID=36100 RepID=UPI001EE5442D|nr:MYCBP-associated protein-like [Haliotis rubra]